VQAATDATGKELAPKEILTIFQQAYLTASGRFGLADYQVDHVNSKVCHVKARVTDKNSDLDIAGEGTGAIDAFVAGIAAQLGLPVRVGDYSEHAMGAGADAEAAAYVSLKIDGGARAFGAGRDRDIVKASFEAMLRALEGVVVQ
jgi:2-isopropylmalate synthase